MNGWQTASVVLYVLTGTVYDSQHHVIPSAKVYLQDARKQETVMQTDERGVYRFSVPVGIYEIHAEGEAPIRVTVNQANKLDLIVQPAFYDEPKFKAAGVADYTYQGGHGSDAVLRSGRAMAKDLEENHDNSGDPREMEHFNKGTELLSHKETQAAISVFSKGVEEFPNSVRMLLGLASAYYSAESFDEAARWFYRATDVAPHDPKPYLFLAKVEARQITDAVGYKERMERFARLQPENAFANYYYGITLPDERARAVFEKAVQLDPKLAPAYVKLGVIAAREGRPTEAAGSYQKAIELDPSLGEAHYRLSEVYRAMGESEKAKKEVKIFQELQKKPH